MIGIFFRTSLFILITHTWILSLGDSIKTRLALFVNEIYFQGKIRLEDVHWLEFGFFNFHVLSNYDFSVRYVPIRYISWCINDTVI